MDIPDDVTMHRSAKEGMGLRLKGIFMKKDMYGFTVKLRDKEFTSEQFRTLCEYESVTLSIYSDGLLDALIAQWNMVMPISSRAELYFDGEKSTGFKRKLDFHVKSYEPCVDPRRSGGVK